MAKLHRQKSKTAKSVSPVAATSKLNLGRLGVEEVAKIFAGSGYRTCTAAAIAADLAAGAPAGEDGKVNLIHYAAWLVQHQ